MGSLCSNDRSNPVQSQPAQRTASLYSQTSTSSAHSAFSLKSEERNFYALYNQSQDLIGFGAHGEIRICEHKFTGEKFAVKLITKASVPEEVLRKRLIPKQFKLVSVLDHPSILKFHDMYEDRNRFFILMDYVSGGDLFQRLKETPYFSETAAARVMKQIFSGLAHMHSKKIAHRDIKPENILIEEKNKKLSIKVIDFDTAIDFENRVLTDKQGSLYYIAPEVIKGKYNEKCDVWSAGVTLFVLLTNRFPFNGEDETELQRSIIEDPLDVDYLRNERISDDAIHLLERLLDKNYKKRFSASDASHHHWILKNSHGPLRTPIIVPVYNPLAHAVKLWIAKCLVPHQDILRYQLSFIESDANADGFLEVQEIFDYFQKLSLADAQRIIECGYWKNKGKLDLYEFISVTAENEFWVTNKILIENEIVWSSDNDVDSQFFIEFLSGKLGGKSRLEGIEVTERLKKDEIMELLSC
jgi:serine/threonine protein kinase